MRAGLPALERLVATLAADGSRRPYLLGMGGSSLAAEVLRRSEGNPTGRELTVVDMTDPERVLSLLDGLDPVGELVRIKDSFLPPGRSPRADGTRLRG